MTTTTHLTEALRNATETPLRALTVQQPWAWAILHGGKDVENRTQAWAHRGPLLIHAGQRWSERGGESPLVTAAAWEVGGDVRPTAQHYGPDFVLPGPEWPTGAILGVAQLVDVHTANPGCCDSPWAETSYDEHGGKTRRDVVHLVLDDARPLPRPIPCRGMLGLWTPPLDVLAQIVEYGIQVGPDRVIVGPGWRCEADVVAAVHGHPDRRADQHGQLVRRADPGAPWEPVHASAVVLCDGCNVREPWEHRCFRDGRCTCPECREEDRLFGSTT